MSAPVTYADVNGAWGGVILPPITTKEAAPLFAKLIAKFGRHPDKVSTSVPYWARKGRRVWASPKPQDTKYAANGGLPGLGRMVHDASHVVFEDHHPGKLTHCQPHAALEKAMVEYVVRKGWHRPKPAKAKPTPAANRQAELERLAAAEKRWRTKAKRAATALSKIARRKRRLHALQDADDRAVVKRVNELVSAMHR